MSGDDYEAINRFFITVTKQDAPALSAQYGFAEAAMWQQLSDEFPGALMWVLVLGIGTILMVMIFG